MSSVHFQFSVAWLIVATSLLLLPYGWRPGLAWRPSITLSQRSITLLLRSGAGIMACLAFVMAGGAGSDLVLLNLGQLFMGAAAAGLAFAEPIGWILRGERPPDINLKRERAFVVGSRAMGLLFLLRSLVGFLWFA